MTTKEKLEIFELARTYIVNYYWSIKSNIRHYTDKYNYICCALEASIKSKFDTWNIPLEISDILFKYKPENVEFGDAWWSTNDLGMRKRIEVLDDIIKNLKLELSNESSNIN